MQLWLRVGVLAAMLLACAPVTPAPTAAPTTVPTAAPSAQPSPTAMSPTATAQPSPLPPTLIPVVTQPTTSASPTPRPPTATATTRAAAAPTRTPLPTPQPTPAVTLPITEWKVDALVVGPGAPGRLFAFQRGTVLGETGVIGARIRLWFSDDFGAAWRAFAGGLPVADPACMNNLTMDYATADALYASTCQGIYRWTGQQWTRISVQKTGALSIMYGRPSLMWATGFRPDPYIIRSEDGGVTWQRADMDLDTFTGQANIGIDPRDAKTIYSMISPKYAGSYLRRGDATGHWVTMPVPTQGYTYIGMTIDGATGALYVATLMADGHWQLWRSPNPSDPDLGQVRWETVFDFGEPSVDTFAQVLASGAYPQGPALFVRFDLGNCSPLQGIPCTSTVLRSLNGGKGWSRVPVPEN